MQKFWLLASLTHDFQFELHAHVRCLQDISVQHVQDSILTTHLYYDKIVWGKDWLVIRIRWSMVENLVNYLLHQILLAALYLLTLLQSLFSLT